MKQIIVLVPVYQRPHRVWALLESFERSEPTEARLVFIVSPEDSAEREMLADVDHLVMPYSRRNGDWARKINCGYRATREPWILCGADDIDFQQGWDQALLSVAAKTRKRVIGSNDLNPHADKRGVYSPHPLVARSYADELGTIDGPGRVVCELYDHNYPDRELAATAVARGEWAFAKQAVIKHLHHGLTDSPVDDTYSLGARQVVRDGKLFEARMGKWLSR